jgi:F-type H+-transporting ATPase subunit a
MSFVKLVTAPRSLIAIVLIAVGVVLNTRYSPHHSGANPFQVLYMHLIPAKLVAPGEHAAETHGAVEQPVEQQPEHGAAAEHEGESAHGAAHYLLSIDLPFTGPKIPVFMPHGFDMDPEHAGTQLVLTNLQIFQVLAVLLVFVCFGGVPRYLRTGRGDALTRVCAGFAMWIRDEMVYGVMGKHHGEKFVPYFLSLFFFLLLMNLMGLAPGAATATASIHVTLAMACVTFASMLVCGMVAQGPIKFWLNLVPHVPWSLWPLMFVVELVGLCVKPFALMIRLFANMTGGHLVVLSFMGLIFFFANPAKGSAALGWAVSPVAVAFAVFIMIIESFVALLQAFIFTQLSILFVNASVHPEH